MLPYPSERDCAIHITTNMVHYNLWELIGTYTASLPAFQKAMDFINKKELQLELLIEEEYSMEQVQEAFEAPSRPDQYRVMLNL